jgi:hypothetical protein
MKQTWRGTIVIGSMAASLGLGRLGWIALCDADVGRANSNLAAPLPAAGEMPKAGRIRIAGRML